MPCLRLKGLGYEGCRVIRVKGLGFRGFRVLKASLGFLLCETHFCMGAVLAHAHCTASTPTNT